MQRPSHLSVLPGGAAGGARGGPQASLWMTLRKYLPPPVFFRLLNFWPPYLGAGVRVAGVGEGGRNFDIELRLRWWNRNYVGVQFGGSIYSMCDPFFMAILMEALGPDYTVWDKAAAVRFLRPGRSTVRARFEVSEDRIADIRSAVDAHGKDEPLFVVPIVDEQGVVVAEVEKRVWVRRVRPAPAGASPRT